MLFPWYIKYPNQNDEILNLDWILSTIDNLVNEVANFVSLNTIKYADPIQWNITTQYEKNTVVIDPITGTAYISTKPVPAGVGLNNTDYWNLIFTLDVISANKNITLRDDANNILATFESAKDDWLIWQGTLYIVTRAIEVGQSYVVGYNIYRFTVEMYLKNYISNLKTYVDTNIGALTDLNTEDKTSVVNAINEVVNSVGDIITLIGDLDDLTTTDKSSVVAAINEIVSIVGDLDDLTTTDKSSVVAAINEAITSILNVNNKIGDLIYLHTSDKTSVVAAINEVFDSLGSGNVIDDNLKNKKVLVVGDSISDESHFPNCWVKYLKEVPDITVDAVAINGGTLSGIGGIAEAFINRAVEAYDYIVIQAGVNDWGAQVTLGNYGSTSISTFMGAINSVITHIKTYYASSKVYWITPLPTFFDISLVSGRKVSLNMYRSAIYYLANLNKQYLIDGACGIPNYNDNLTLDHIHPNSTGARLLNELVKKNLLIPSNQVGDIWDYFDFSATTAGLSGTIRVLTNCHGDVIFRFNINVNSAMTPDTFIVLSNDAAWAEYLGTSIPYFPVIYQGQTKVSVGTIAWSSIGIQASTPISEIGRFIGDVFIGSNIMSAPTIQN